MQNSIYLFFLVCSFTFLACEKQLPFPEQDVQPTLVINSTFSVDSLWKVHVSESAPVNGSSQPKNRDNATVILKNEADETLGTFVHDKDGFYHLPNLKPEWGRTYRMEASVSGLGSVTSQSYQPMDFSFKITDTLRSLYLDLPVIFIDVEIKDNADEESYYLVEVEKIIEIVETEEVYRFMPYLYVFDQNTENDEIDTESSDFERVYLPDRAFNGQNYTTRLAVEEDIAEIEDEIEVKWIVRVLSVSSDLYKYTKSLERYNLTNGELFAEPVEIHNNIQNGLGVFGGFTAKETEIIF